MNKNTVHHSTLLLLGLFLYIHPTSAADLTIREPARPSKYLESAGRRAALLGRQDGSFEAWIFPVKLLRDFRLGVYVDNALEPVPLAAHAEWIESRPGRAAITHVHPAFTITTHWAASTTRPAAALLISIETSRDLKLRVSFTPEMKPMWPASFGGQSTSFDPRAKLIRFSEGLRRFRPVAGSPDFVRSSEQIGHQMPDRTLFAEMDISRERAAQGPIPIIFAASEEAYKEELARTPSILSEIDSHYASYADKTLALDFPPLQPAFDHARMAIHSGWACNEGVGCGLIAGWGPSGLSERPGFGWYFGGDAMMSAWAMSDTGDFSGARDALQFLIDHSRPDGKIMHELPQSAALLDWPKYPYGFYHADTTPLMLFTAARYIRQSGDRAFLERNWHYFEKCWAFSKSMIGSGALLSNEKGGAAAVETGALSGKVRRDVYLQGVWLGGLTAFGEMARWMVRPDLEKESAALLIEARKSVSAWFDPSKGYFAFAELKDGSRYTANSGWQSFLIAHGGLDPAIASRAAASLALPTLATPWGTRMFATDSPFYNPLGYNDGSVWPFVTAQASLALFHNGQPKAGFDYVWGMVQSTGLAGPGLLTEYLSGDRFAEGPRSVPHQIFSSVALVHPFIAGALGLEGNAFDKTLTLAPRLPRFDGSMRLSRYRVGDSLITATFTSTPAAQTAVLEVAGPPLTVLTPAGNAGPLAPGRPLTLRFPASDYDLPAWRLTPGQRPH